MLQQGETNILQFSNEEDCNCSFEWARPSAEADETSDFSSVSHTNECQCTFIQLNTTKRDQEGYMNLKFIFYDSRVVTSDLHHVGLPALFVVWIHSYVIRCTRLTFLRHWYDCGWSWGLSTIKWLSLSQNLSICYDSVKTDWLKVNLLYCSIIQQCIVKTLSDRFLSVPLFRKTWHLAIRDFSTKAVVCLGAVRERDPVGLQTSKMP